MATRAAIAAMLRFHVREALKSTPLRSFAAQVKLSHPIVFTIRTGENQLSRAETVERLGLHFGIPPDKLHTRADEFALAHPDLVAAEDAAPAPAPATRVEYPDRYPERAAAAEASRAMGLSRSAIDRVCGWELKGGESMSRWDWLEEFRSEARREARERINPDTVEEQRQHAIRSGQELLARERELLAGREQLLRTPKGRKPME